MGINWTLKSTPINEFPIKEPQVDAGKRELKPSVFIYVYPWFIEDIWNRCTSVASAVKCSIKSITNIHDRSILED